MKTLCIYLKMYIYVYISLSLPLFPNILYIYINTSYIELYIMWLVMWLYGRYIQWMLQLWRGAGDLSSWWDHPTL